MTFTLAFVINLDVDVADGIIIRRCRLGNASDMRLRFRSANVCITGLLDMSLVDLPSTSITIVTAMEIAQLRMYRICAMSSLYIFSLSLHSITRQDGS
jgi:hypothetical protein